MEINISDGQIVILNGDDQRFTGFENVPSITINPKRDMQKIVTLDGFRVRADPREHLKKTQLKLKTNFRTVSQHLGWVTDC